MRQAVTAVKILQEEGPKPGSEDQKCAYAHLDLKHCNFFVKSRKKITDSEDQTIDDNDDLDFQVILGDLGTVKQVDIKTREEMKETVVPVIGVDGFLPPFA